MSIEVRGLSRRFDGFAALQGVDLRVEPGELVALLGPSGSGKTTLLRIIAGLDFPSEGAILFEGEDASARHVRERRVGFVFQHYALFRHMSVFENVAFGLRVKRRGERLKEAAIRDKVMGLLRLVQLDRLASRYPSQLSGGQRQRVALARALAIEPRVLLLDEPFGALDAKVRKELRRWLRQLHDRMGLTSVFVTHDQEEALELADRIVVMNEGRIEQIGSPEEVYDHPATPFVYEFLGHANRFECVVEGGSAFVCGAPIEAKDVTDGPAIAYLRPHDIDLLPRWEQPGARGQVRYVATVGRAAQIELILDGRPDLVEVELTRDRARELDLKPGQTVRIRARTGRVFASASGAMPRPIPRAVVAAA
jgi:sulfate transport system ATP-binding protein